MSFSFFYIYDTIVIGVFMKLKELKCKNCGANLEVEKNIAMVTYQFCHTTFSVLDTYSKGYNLAKGRLQAIDGYLI